MSDANAMRLQVEHQLDVLFVGVGHAGRRVRQLALLAAAIERFDLLNATLDLAHILEIVAEPRAIGGAQRVVRAGSPIRPPSRECCDPLRRRAARCSGVAPTPNN